MERDNPRPSDIYGLYSTAMHPSFSPRLHPLWFLSAARDEYCAKVRMIHRTREERGDPFGPGLFGCPVDVTIITYPMSECASDAGGMEGDETGMPAECTLTTRHTAVGDSEVDCFLGLPTVHQLCFAFRLRLDDNDNGI